MKMGPRIEAAHVWDERTTRSVLALRVDVALSTLALVDALLDAVDAARHKCALQIIDAARTFGVEVDERDVHLRCMGESGFVRKYRAAWRPDVSTVVLRGGEHDGVEMEVRDPFDALCMARMGAPVWAEREPVEPVQTERYIYNLAGWSERSRRWIMATD